MSAMKEWMREKFVNLIQAKEMIWRTDRKKIEKHEESQGPWDHTKRSNIRVIRVPGVEEKEIGEEK